MNKSPALNIAVPKEYQTPMSAKQQVPLFVIGVILLTVSAVWTWHTFSFVRKAVEAKGTVVNLYPHRGSKGGTTYAPEVTFVAQDGNSYTFVSSVSSSGRPSIGSFKRVLYDPANPGVAQIADTGFWIFQVSIGMFGLVFLLLGFFSKNFNTVTPQNLQAYQTHLAQVAAARTSAPGSTAFVAGAPTQAVGGFMPNAEEILNRPALTVTPNPQLVEYARQSRAAGVDESSIRQALVGRGWEADIVDASLASR